VVLGDRLRDEALAPGAAGGVDLRLAVVAGRLGGGDDAPVGLAQQGIAHARARRRRRKPERG
jgi:hypothetical protein